MSHHANSPPPLELQPISTPEDDNDTTMDEAPDDENALYPPTNTADLNARTLKKLDFILLPFLALLFLFNSLDRSNIGNAETASFTADVGLAPEDLNFAVAVFFAFFVALQPVGAILGRKIGMAIYVPTCMSIWGVCTILHIWVRSKWQLVGLRIVIGALEAGFYPTTVAYLSLFYTRYEFGRRLGLFYGQYAVAGALGGVLSYAVFSRFPKSEGGNGWKSWQVLFLIEGCMTVVLALVGFFWLPHNARSAWFLRPDERRWAEERIRLDQDSSLTASPGHHEASESEETHGLLQEDSEAQSKPAPSSSKTVTDDRGLTREDILEAIFDWKLWYLLLCNILSAIPVTAFSVFLPLILKSLSSNPAYANLLTTPPYLIGAITLYLFTHYSDVSKVRLTPILYSLALLSLGLAGVVLLPVSFPIPRYISLCVLLSGTFIASPLSIAWLANNLPEPGKRSVVLGINGWGNLAGVFSSLLFQPRYAPSYFVPFAVTLCLVLLSFTGYAVFRQLLLSINAERRVVVGEWSEEEVEGERRFGDGPVSRFTGRDGFVDVVTRVLRPDQRLRFKEFVRVEGGRRGDEKITYQYTL